MRYYGLDLIDVIDNDGCRRLWALVEGLPYDSATWREDNEWTNTDELLAANLELSDAWSRLLFRALGGKLQSGSKPIQVQRPGSAQRSQSSSTGETNGKPPIEKDRRKIAQWFMRNA